ncbi:MAG: hypothetical protein ABI614_28295, partial [Planctomycetota bacterium]
MPRHYWRFYPGQRGAASDFAGGMAMVRVSTGIVVGIDWQRETKAGLMLEYEIRPRVECGDVFPLSPLWAQPFRSTIGSGAVGLVAGQEC